MLKSISCLQFVRKVIRFKLAHRGISLVFELYCLLKGFVEFQVWYLKVGMLENESWPWILPTWRFLFGFIVESVVLSSSFYWLSSTCHYRTYRCVSHAVLSNRKRSKSSHGQLTQTCLQFWHKRSLIVAGR